MLPECANYYNRALKAGQKYVKTAVSRGSFPYLLVLDELLESQSLAGYQELGLIDIPMPLIAGTKTTGRTYALSGDFMPLLSIESEFAAKWLHLCDAQLGDEGIHDPVKCYEYLGRFYIEEGNKRVSVLKTLGALSVPAQVTRILPAYSDAEPVSVYYAFLDFYALSGLYDVSFSTPDRYEKLQAALGFASDYVWSEEERRRFQSGFHRFRQAFMKVQKKTGDVSDADALLSFLDFHSFSEIKSMATGELEKAVAAVLPDAEASLRDDLITLRTAPESDKKGLLSKAIAIPGLSQLHVAFIYAYDPDKSVWTREHDMGRRYLEERLGDRIRVQTVAAYDHNYLAAMEQAAGDGADVVFATTPAMIADCRIFASRHSEIKVLNCSLSSPYQSVRTYYSRIYEIKFITGAIAGAMADHDLIGYVADYPIFGVPAGINAFALGVRLTNPYARIQLGWSCIPGDPLQQFRENRISVISNRDAKGAVKAHPALEWGCYKMQDDGSMLTLATPHWYWGLMYRQIIESIFFKTWGNAPKSKAVNYWWGLDSGVIDVKLGPELPAGVRSLAGILREGIIGGSVSPYRTQITDQEGKVHNDGQRDLSAEEILGMDYLCENVIGKIPDFDALTPESMETVRKMGIYRETLPPEIKEKQL